MSNWCGTSVQVYHSRTRMQNDAHWHRPFIAVAPMLLRVEFCVPNLLLVFISSRMEDGLSSSLVGSTLISSVFLDCLSAVFLFLDCGTTAVRCCIARRRWEAQLVWHTAVVLRGIGPWNSCSTLLRCFGAMGSRTQAVHYRTTSGYWAFKIMWYTDALPWDSGHRNCCNHYCNAWGQSAVELLCGTVSATVPRPTAPR